MKNIGEKLKNYFKEWGITQNEMNAALGIRQSYISDLISGKKPFGKKAAAKFSEVYGLNEAFLLTGEGEMFPGESGTPNNNVVIDGKVFSTMQMLSETILSQQRTIEKLTDKK
jgi:transcriptional regulator with XRE-family HTH domain